MEGYVFRWTNFIKGYKPRYLVLKDNTVSISKVKNDTKCEVIDLKTSKVCDDKKKNFIIDCGNKKLYFKTNTENEKKEWINKLIEHSKPTRNSNASEHDRETLNVIRKTISSNVNKLSGNVEEFNLIKSDSCVVENFIKTNEIGEIPDYLQKENLNLNPMKNRKFSNAYNTYYKEINKIKKNKLTKFESLINSFQNMQNMCYELNTVMENFNLSLMSSKSKSKPIFTKIYEDLFNIKQEIKEQLDHSVKYLVEYKEEEDKIMPLQEEQNISFLRENDETFYVAKECDEMNHNVKNQIRDHIFETRINIDNVADIKFQNLEEINIEEDSDSSFEDCFSHLDCDNEFRDSVIKESIENEGKFKRSLSMIYSDFFDINYNFSRRELTDFPRIKCSNSMLSDMLKSLMKEKIALPIHYNEPLSMLQKECEKFQHSRLLFMAANEENFYLKLSYLAAFIVAEVSLYVNRILKPFNPILAETFEYFDNDLKYRYFSEQVSHKPPVSAFICESEDFVVFGDTRCKTKFKLLKGAMEILFQNKTNILFKKTDEQFSFNKPTAYMKGLVMGTPHFDFTGIVTIEELNQNNKAKAVIDFFEEGRKSKPIGYLEGKILDESGVVVYLLKGNWNEGVYITDKNGNNRTDLWTTGNEAFITNKDVINNYLISNYACNFNILPTQEESGLSHTLPPTDSRFRPDQKALEIGNLQFAETEKHRIEEKQRQRHKQFEDERIKYEPTYFADVLDKKTNEYVYIYKGGYWEDRKNKNFKHLHNIFK